MKRLVVLLALALMAGACTEPAQVEMDRFSGLDQHCREHAEDMYAEDFAPGRYMECMDLHLDGVVVADSTDQHLAARH